MGKVYCKNCRHMKMKGTVTNGFTGETTPFDITCNHLNNIQIIEKIDTWWEQTIKSTYNESPDVRNKDNLCSEYERNF